MKLPRSKKARRRMFGLIFLYSGIILSLGTSTMAWYSVQANVNIDVESASITIKTPFQYHFYAFNDNGFDVSDSEPNNWTPGTGYKTAPINKLNGTAGGNFSDNYTEINELVGGQTVSKNGNARALTTVSGLWPGYSMSFAIKAEGLETGTGGDHPVLKIHKKANAEDTAHINPGSGAGKTPGRYVKNTSTPIYFAEAIQISAWSGATLSSLNDDDLFEIVNDDEENSKPVADNWWSGNGSIGLGSATNHSGTYWWVFTVTFVDIDKTWYSFDSNSDGRDYYVKYSGSGSTAGFNSSCYEGLTFELGEMTLKNPGS